MKIAVLAAGYPPDIRGGGEFSSQIFAEALAEGGAQVDVLCCGAQEETYTNNNVTIHRVLSPNIFWSFQTPPGKIKQVIWHARENYNPQAQKLISGFVDRIKPDIFVTSTIENFGAEAWRAPKAMGVKTAHILRSYYPFCRRATAFKGQHNCAKPCLDCAVGSLGRRQASQYVDGLIGLSRVILDRHLKEGFFKNAARAIIPDPVYGLSHEYTPKPRQESYVFGYLGYLTPNKGLEVIADAIQANPQFRAADIRIAGTGEAEYVEQLKARFDGTNAKFVGWQDAEKFLEQIDFLIVPSVFNEPFGRIVAEAFTSGVPVIGSKTGGIGEMVADGQNGFAFVPGDASSLAAVLQKAVAMDHQTYAAFSENALVSSKNFTGDEVAKKNFKFFEDLLSGQAQSGREWVYTEDAPQKLSHGFRN